MRAAGGLLSYVMAKTGVLPSRQKPNDRLRDLPPRTAAMLGEAVRLIDRRDYDGAERALTGALVLAAEHPETARLHGLIRHRRGRLAEAEEIYRRALIAHPADAALASQLGELRIDRGDVAEGFALLRRATEIAPDDMDAWFRFGVQLDKYAMNEQALAAGRRIVALAPDHRLGRHLIARNLHALGFIDEAAAEYRRLIALGGDRAYQAWFSLVDIKTVRLDANEIAALQRSFDSPKTIDEARAPLGFALGKVYEDAGRYAEALAAFSRANAIVRRGIAWDAAAFSGEIDETMRVFSNETAQAPASLGGETLFVLGMPRSSTTLIEQILAAHPDVEGASELPDLPAIIAQESNRRGMPFAAWAAIATAADWERLGREYLERTVRWRKERARSTDKLPHNWMLVGAIRAMLPAAKIVDCRRDPLETCWSCYKQLFAPGLVRYAYDFGELAAQWRDYDRLARFWAKRHPTHVRAQSYETLLDEPEREIRALLEFCGLPFDEACLHFHESKRSVRSASAGQVRQPLRRDTARAARYGDLLAPLRDGLKETS